MGFVLNSVQKNAGVMLEFEMVYVRRVMYFWIST